MPSVEANDEKWGQSYDWTEGGDEWSATWGGSETHWTASILPRINAFLPASRVLEIAPGYGRWTPFLLANCDSYIGVDLAESCIEVCEQRFAGETRATFALNDGVSLPMVPDDSIDFAFSFDSLVHAEKDVMRAYVQEMARVLRPDGVAFLHHSNMGAYAPSHERAASLQRVADRSGAAEKVLHKLELTGWTHWRAPSMTAAAMVVMCRETRVACVGQELVTWGGLRRLIDCFTVITRPGSKYDRPLVVERNRHYMAEALSAGHLSKVFTSLGPGHPPRTK